MILRLRVLAGFLLVLTIAACNLASSPTPSFREWTVPFELTGTWARCHQMGACKYTVELTSPDGVRSAELLRLNAVGDQGALTPETGFPTKLAAGPHTLTVVSTMYGDTIEPNGEQTVLGEEARCATDFVVAPTATRFVATVAFVPGSCTVTLRGEGVEP